MSIFRYILLFSLISMIGRTSFANVILPNIYTDSMVIQRNADLSISGLARKNSTVRVSTSWNKEVINSKADKKGQFSICIKTPDAGGPYTITFDDGNKTTLKDILVGDVWVCSGQSNMEMPMVGWGTMDSEREIARAHYPNLRLLYIKRDISLTPKTNANVEFGGWQSANPESVKIFSSIGYLFGREINQQADVPIGIIDCSWGGTPIESWMSYDAINQTGELSDFLEIMPKNKDELPDWDNCPRWIREQRSINSYPTVLFNAMVSPLQSMPIKGVLWYQGCSNVGRSQQYSKLFKSMIQDWRKGWQQPELPFYFVQIASYLQPKWLQPESEWAKIRQAQADALCLPNTGMAVTIDLGNPDDIHPKNKQAVAQRLAAIALNNDYDMPCEYMAPKVVSTEVNGRYITLNFDGDVSVNGGGQGFIIKDASGNWRIGYGRQLAKNIVEVSSDEISTPTELRYGWADYPECSLRGVNTLPVAPFKIDNL